MSPNVRGGAGCLASTLIGYGLGEELGAIPIITPGSAILASFNKLDPLERS